MSAVVATRRSQPGDRIFSRVVFACSILVVLLLLLIVSVLVIDSLEAITHFGLGFLTKSEWDPVVGQEQFGALPYIFGTVVTSLIALLLATPLAIGAAIFVNEYTIRPLGNLIAFVVELLVAIPSVAYGLWGLFVVVPFMRTTINPFLKNVIGPIPIIGELFKGPNIGNNILTAGVILAIMILPTILAVSREIVRQVPRLQKEGMIALGATKWESIRVAVLPYARAGIVGGAMLGLARAIGETMAVTMVIGNSSKQISASLFTPGYTLASAIATQFNEADTSLYFSAVVALGLVLMIVSSAINLFAHFLVSRTGGTYER